MPKRIQLSRKSGFRLPENAVKVDRSTLWGNPFVVGQHGDAERCVSLFRLMAQGLVPISFGREMYDDASTHHAFICENIQQLRGKDLACWCKLCLDHKNGKPSDLWCAECKPCHADVLLEIANVETR
jgi:Domain of unknown function (DUF4326)